MWWLTLKILLRQKERAIITLVGIVFASVLTLIEIAIYLGMMGNATAVINHVDADIWIVSKNVQSFDFALPFPKDRINHVRSLEDILWAEKLQLNFGFIKLADGGREQAQLIGFDPDKGVGAPWNMMEGNARDVKGGRYMIIDKTAEQRLGQLQIGSLWELTIGKAESFKLVGLSDGIKSFTTMPVIFMSYNQLDKMLAEAGGQSQTTFIVAKVRDPSRLPQVINTLQTRLRDNDVLSKDDFIRRTVLYWTVQTGMGMAFFLTAILAVLIGGAIVGQTIYASTVEHLREYGTLKALGAHNREIYLVIFGQAGINAVIGYLLSLLVIAILQGGMIQAGVPLELNFTLFLTVFLVMFITCLSAAFFSVRQIRTLDPVSVFKS